MSLMNGGRYRYGRICLCGARGCTCLPDPRDIQLSPGERIIFGSKLRVDGFSNHEDFWIRCGSRNIVELERPSRDAIEGLRKLLDALYRKTIHVPNQDEETRLWAVEKLMEVPNLSL